MQKISGIVQWQTTPFLIYTFVNLKVVAFYGNYTIITDKLAVFVNTFLESTGAGIGNLIAEGNKSKIKSVFWELLSARYFIAGTICFSIYHLIDPFIVLWLGKEYILDHIILVLITISIFISYTRGGVMQFLYGYGLFRDVWAPVAEIVLNLGTAIICGKLYGLPGVLMGGIVSQILIVGIWKPYFLYHCGFKESVFYYWGTWIKYVMLIFIPWIAIELFFLPILDINPSHSFLSWILYAGIIVLLYSISSMILLFVFTSGMKNFLYRFINKKK